MELCQRHTEPSEGGWRKANTSTDICLLTLTDTLTTNAAVYDIYIRYMYVVATNPNNLMAVIDILDPILRLRFTAQLIA
jgi:hypothetical protein